MSVDPKSMTREHRGVYALTSNRGSVSDSVLAKGFSICETSTPGRQMKQFFDGVAKIFWTIVGAFFAGGAAMILLSLIALVVSFSGGDGRAVQTEATMIGAFVVGAAVVLIAAIVHSISEANRRAVEEAKRGREEIVASARNRKELVERIIAESRVATNQFSWMPVRLQGAAQQTAQARATFRDGAFSPFWSAIESAYTELAHYRALADSIGSRAVTHAALVRQLGTTDLEFTTFPVTLDVAQVQQQHRLILAQLDAIVYEAQKQPTFAMIWEQRRTTAAVIEGFRNLEDAVQSMGDRVTSSIAHLSSQLHASSVSIASEIGAQNAAQSSANADQLAELRGIRREADDIREHLYRPELSRWLH